MLRLINLKDCKDVQDIANRLRTSFATVFSRHYGEIIHNEIEKFKRSEEYKSSKELKEIPPDLKGFKDVLSKPQYFEKNIYSLTQKEIQSRLFKLYFGPGFDDEVAFLLAFHDLKHSKLDPLAHYHNKKDQLTKDQCAEIDDYLPLLKGMERVLKEVNFLAVTDQYGNIHGFALYHVLQEGDKTFLHIRQAAMMEKSRGYASVMARYFTDHYPAAIYEANQRKANRVPMKEMLISEHLIDIIPPVLGYKPEFYQGLRARDDFQKVLLQHYDAKPHKLGISKYGQFFEAESIPNRFFNPTKLQKDFMAFEEDTHVKDHLSYLKQVKFKP